MDRVVDGAAAKVEVAEAAEVEGVPWIFEADEEATEELLAL